MEKRIKLIIVGLAGILFISLIINLQAFTAKKALERERNDLRRENASLSQKIEASLQDNRRLENKISSLNLDLDRVSKEKDEMQNKFDSVNRERQELIEKLKEQKKPAAVTAGPVSEDAYWAGILKAKTDLEMQLDNLRSELKIAQINNEQLQREKNNLGLEVNNLAREKEDLKRQLDYNQKLMDSLAQELVREKNDKFQISDTLKSIKGENEVLRRQLRTLDGRKINLERRFTDLQKENTQLDSRLKEMETLLQDRSLQIDNLKRQLSAIQSGKPIAAGEKESVELPPIVVRPQPQAQITTAAPAGLSVTGKILAVNKDNNFVIIDLGLAAGISVGDKFQIFRDNDVIADIEVIQAREKIAACDIKKEISPIKVGDTIR